MKKEQEIISRLNQHEEMMKNLLDTFGENFNMIKSISELHKKQNSNFFEILELLDRIMNFIDKVPEILQDTKHGKNFQRKYEETLQGLKDTIDRKMKEVDENNKGLE